MDIDTYVLIGGSSSRFGSDKATFVWGGKTLAARAAETITAALSPTNISFAAASRDQFDADLGRTIGDILPGRGAVGALHTALHDAVSDWIFVLACDLPMVSEMLIAFLGSKISDEYDAVVPMQPDGFNQPLCSFYKVETCRPAFAAAAAEEGRVPSLHSIIGTLNSRFVRFEEYAHLPNSASLLKNANTLMDLETLLNEHAPIDPAEKYR